NDDTVADRAAILIHEGWHAWGAENLNSDYRESLPASGHEVKLVNGPIGNCTNPVECDHFRPHVSNAFMEGALVNAGMKTKVHTGEPMPRTVFHSVYQVELEYLCDAADFSDDDIPYSVREAAASLAKVVAKSDLVETVPFLCGSTRPFWTKDAG